MSENRIKYRMGLLLALLVAPLLTFAQATLSISNFSITQGETKEVLIELDNTVEIRALQVRIVLPDSIIMAARPELVAERIGGSMDDFGEWMPSTKSLSYNHWDDGSHMIMVNSDDGIPFSGTEGGVIRLKLTAAEDALPGDYNIEVKDVELVYSDGVDYIRQEDISCPVTIVTRKYQITYLLDGSIYGIDSIVPGEKLIPEEYPVKEGHTFSGWMGLLETMPSHDVTVTGSFAVNEYAITYTVDGEVFHTDSIAYGTALTAIAAPVKEGYTFSGWMGLPDTMPAKDVTVTGSFTVNKYLVTFKIGDEVIVSDSLEYGSTIVAPDAPEKEGHTFDGWGEVAERVPAKDLTYDGSYSVNFYLLTYTVDGEVFHTDSIAYGTSLTAIAVPVKEGYTFSGWIGLPETMPAKDVTVTGSFTVNKYLVTFKIGDEVIVSDSLEYGSTIVAPDAPEKEGHTFDGWGEVAERVPANDLTYDGSYSVNFYLLTYTVDGEVFHTDSIAYGTALTAIAAPVKEGYTFSGWMGLPDTMPAKDVAVTGSFVTNGYTLTYVIDGEVYKTILYEYNAVVIAEASPVKEGHTFHGWIGLPETMPAKDVTVTGSFTVNKYLVTFKIGDEVIVSDSLEYGSTIVAPDAPEKEGHTFDGWGEVAERVPANDLTYDGSYSVNFYLLTYTVDGEVFHTDSIAYGTALIAIAAPVKEGYTFSGWIGLPESMPAEDVTITGSFILNATQTDEQGLMYTLNESRDAFGVAGYAALTVQDVVIPAVLYELPVTSVKEKALMGADAVNSVVIPASVDKVGEKAFYGCSNLLSVEWNATAPLSANVFDKPSNHGNMLVHVADTATMIGYQGNVVVAGVAERITLIDDMPLRNTNRFIARHITFDHTFAKRTKIGVSGGWEAMVLPFDVQRVVSETKGELKPFGEADFETSLPYWLGELQTDGAFAAVQTITANKPFIMQLPNSDEYEDIYNVEGKVTFSAEEVTVHATIDVEQEKSVGYSLLGSYEGTESDNYIYALNDEEYAAGGDTYMPGGVFVAGSRDIRPFEAYVYSSQIAPAPYLRIGGKGTNGIDHSTLNTQPSTIYDLMGRKVLNTESLKGGIYIVNGKKVVIE